MSVEDLAFAINELNAIKAQAQLEHYNRECLYESNGERFEDLALADASKQLANRLTVIVERVSLVYDKIYENELTISFE